MRTDDRVTGHLQVKGPGGARKYFAHWTDRGGGKRTRTLGRAWVKDTGRRTPRGATVWRAAHGPCPPDALTPKAAEAALAAILDEARRAPRQAPTLEPPSQPAIPTFRDAVDAWLSYVAHEKERKRRTVQDYRYPVTAVKEFAGHRDLATTMKYVHRQTKAEDAQRGGAYLNSVLAAEATAV